MPHSKPDDDFDIYIDPSCLNTPMDEETTFKAAGSDTERETELHPSIETDTRDEENEENSILSERTDGSYHPDDGDQSSSQHEGTDEDVFTDKSPRSSMGSYDASSESGKGVDVDSATTITRSPRISDISQYDKEDFIPTARGTPRPPFRTPSDVRAMQMSSPTGSVVGSPRSSRKHFATGSRLGTPSASAQYSPKRKSTPPRFKSRQEAPLVLLHVTLLPLRWMWGELVNNLDPAEMSDQAKTLRSSWRLLQDRVGDTVVERGILLGHPQNDYEVLEERLLEALDLPVRRRARILECGHYLGPSNEATITEDEEESEDEHGQHRRQSASNRHWCGTCKSEIRYDALGEVKVFRVKVYASNGLMRAGAWEACWKEMERVDVELEPIVEPTVQDEIVRLAAAQQEREIAQQEEAQIAKDVAMEYEKQRRSEEEARSQSRSPPAPEVIPEATREHIHESRTPSHHRYRDGERPRETYGQSPPTQESSTRQRSSHRQSDSYNPTPPPRYPEEEAHERKGEQTNNQHRGYQSASLPVLLLQSAKVLIQDPKNLVILALGVFVLILSLRRTPPEQHYEPIIYRLKNMPETQQLPIIETSPVVPEQERPMEARDAESIVATPSLEVPHSTPSEASPDFLEASPSYEAAHTEPSMLSSDYLEAPPVIEEPSIIEESSVIEDPSVIEEPSVMDIVSQIVSQSSQDAFTTPTSVSTIYEPCASPTSSSPLLEPEASSAISEDPIVEEPRQEIGEETIHEIVERIETATEKTIVKVVQTVTRTQTHTQTQIETQTEVETATAVEIVIVTATEAPQLETSSDVEETMLDSRDETVIIEDGLLNDKIAEIGPEAEALPEVMPEHILEATPESSAEAITEVTAEVVAEVVVEPVVEPIVEPVIEPVAGCITESTVEPEQEVPIEA